jgi:exonuclease III
LCGGAHLKNFAKTYILANGFTILCHVHDNMYVSKGLVDSDQDKHERSLPKQNNSSCPFDNEVRVTTLYFPNSKYTPKAKNKLQYQQNITPENQRATNPYCPNRTKKQKAPTTTCPETPFQIQIIQKSSTLASR